MEEQKKKQKREKEIIQHSYNENRQWYGCHSLRTFTELSKTIFRYQLNISAQVSCQVCVCVCLYANIFFFSLFQTAFIHILPQNAVKNNYVYTMAVKIILFLFFFLFIQILLETLLSKHTLYFVMWCFLFVLLSNIYFLRLLLFIIHLHLYAFSRSSILFMIKLSNCQHINFPLFQVRKNNRTRNFFFGFYFAHKL